jgi:hypothetical protein
MPGPVSVEKIRTEHAIVDEETEASGAGFGAADEEDNSTGT